MAEKTIQRWQLYKARNVALTNEFTAYEAIYKDIRDYLAPRTARFPGELTNDPTRQDGKIIHSGPRFAVRTLASGMQSGVTSPMRPWFKLGLPDPELEKFQPVKEWLYMVEFLIREVLGRSNIYDRLKSLYGTTGTYGTGCFFVDEDDDDIIRGYDFPIGSFRLATGPNNRVNTMFRDVTFTTEQMVQKFGAKAPETCRLAYDRGDYYSRYSVVHIVEPNYQYTEGSALSERKKFASVWFDPTRSAEESILKYSGYDYNPMMGVRWDLLGEDTYGIGCGEIALGDNKQLQLMEKRKLQGIDKNVTPPMVADASLRNQRTSMLPGDTTYVNGLIATGNQGYRPAYQVNPYINELREEIQAVSMRIDEAFHKNLFQTIIDLGDQPNITATQINALREEKLLMLGPVLERLNDELLGPLIDTVFYKLQVAGMLPPPPEEIQGMPLRIEYISVLAQAQKAMGIGNIERYIGFVMNVSQLDPTARHKLNTLEAVDAYADAIAVPPKLVNPNDYVAQMAQAEQQQAQMANAAAMAEPVSNAAKNISQAAQTGQQAGLNMSPEQINQVMSAMGMQPMQGPSQ